MEAYRALCRPTCQAYCPLSSEASSRCVLSPTGNETVLLHGQRMRPEHGSMDSGAKPGCDCCILHVRTLAEEHLVAASARDYQFASVSLTRLSRAEPFFAMYTDMAPEGGVTVHFIDNGEDTGDILAQTSFLIPLGMRSSELVRISQERGVALMVEVLEKLASGEVTGTRQPATSPTPRGRNLTIDEMWDRIDWDTWPVERIFHCLRYLEPRLHEIESLKLPWYSRWEVTDFTKTLTEPTSGKNSRILYGKNGSIVLRKRSLWSQISVCNY